MSDPTNAEETQEPAATPESPKGVSHTRRWIGLLVLVILSGVVIALASQSLRVFRVTSGSMLPTIEIGDFLVVDGRRPVSPRRGDIVVILNPQDRTEALCKRVVARPKDRVAFRDGRFFLNGETQHDSEPYVTTHRISLKRDYAFRLGGSEYFVLGDNRAVSFDSLEFGPVAQADFLGIVRGIYWPRSRAREFHPNGDD